MYRKRIVKIAGPSILLLGSVMAFGAMRANVVSSTADAGPPYEQSAGDLPGLGQTSKGPLFNRSANEQQHIGEPGAGQKQHTEHCASANNGGTKIGLHQQ